MGSFIGYDDVGVWATNDERDAFLEWFAENRCTPGDVRWGYCKADDWWGGRGVDLEEIVPTGRHLGLTGNEYSTVAAKYWHEVAELLGIIDAITRGDWQIQNGTMAAYNFRLPARYRQLGGPHYIEAFFPIKLTQKYRQRPEI